MKLDRWLKGRPLWLVLPAVWSNVGALLLLASWAWSTPAFVPQPQAGLFANQGLIFAAVLQLAVLAAGTAAQRAFRALAAGRSSATPEARLVALGELRLLPEKLSQANGLAWAVGGIGLSLLAVFLSDAPWLTSVRFGLAALVGGALSTVLLSLLVTERCWAAFDRLSVGLRPAQILQATPPVDWSVRWRTVLFTVVLTLGPLLLVADVANALVERAPDTLRSVAPAARALTAEDLLDEALVRLGLPTLLALVFAMITASAAGKTIAEPMHRLADDAGRVMRGNLGTPRVIAADGEVWRVTGVFAQLCERLALLIDKVVDAGLQVRSATEVLIDTSTRSEATATEQAAALNETSATTEELARSARQIANNAASVEELARLTLEAAQRGQADAGAFQSAVDRMKQDNRSIAGAVDRLQRRVQQIGRIVELINTVADRSDLLALSAELEGSRAGEVGRGFALVGSEMRRLAENVLESTGEVDVLIAEIREATTRTADATARGSSLTEHGTALADHVTSALTHVAELAHETATSVRTITLSTQQQQSGTDQLAESMGEILKSTRGDLDATHEVARMNQQLVVLADSLSKVVTRFTSGQGGR